MNLKAIGLGLALFSFTQPGLRSAEQPASNSQHSAITPAPREGNWMKRHESFNAKVQANQGNIDLAFIGDSITQGWEGRGKRVWDLYYGHRKTLNLGIGGDRTQHVLWRMENGNLDGIQPKLAVIMIGTNNSANDRNTATEMVDGIRAVVAQLRSHLPKTKLLLLGIFPRGETFNERRGKILQVNQSISRMHDGKFVHYLDIGKEFIEDDGTLSPSIMPDFLHLSTAGYGIWARAIEPFISSHLGDSPVKPKSVDVSGAWTFEIESPEGMATGSLNLRAESDVLKGNLSLTPDRVLPLKSGGQFQEYIHFQIVRDRPQGGTMTYNLTGTVKGDKITGNVSARMDGEQINQAWSAKRD